MTVKLLTEHHLEFLSLKGGRTGSSEAKICQNTTLLELTCHDSNMKDKQIMSSHSALTVTQLTI